MHYRHRGGGGGGGGGSEERGGKERLRVGVGGRGRTFHAL